MKCHAGVEYPSGKPCPKCGAKLGEVCWPGINADLLELPRLRTELNELKGLAKGAVEEFPVASGLWTDSDGQDGYGHLRKLRLFLQKSAPVFKAAQHAESDPSVTPDCAGADTALSNGDRANG